MKKFLVFMSFFGAFSALAQANSQSVCPVGHLYSAGQCVEKSVFGSELQITRSSSCAAGDVFEAKSGMCFSKDSQIVDARKAYLLKKILELRNELEIVK